MWFQGFIEAQERSRSRFGKDIERVKKGSLQVAQPRVSQTNKRQVPQIQIPKARNAKRQPISRLCKEPGNTLRDSLVLRGNDVVLH